MTRQEFIQSCRDNGIRQYGKCVRAFDRGDSEILYVAGTPYGHDYGGYHRNTKRAYAWTSEKGWTCLFYNLSVHRADVFLKAYKAHGLDGVDGRVIQNYVTNGYSTRRGLFANYSEEQLERMGGIARSHSFLELDALDSTTAHEIRVQLRN